MRLIFNLLLALFMVAIILLAAIGIYILPTLPDTTTLKDVKMQIPLRIYTSEASLIAEFGQKRRLPISIEDVPPTMIQAFIAAEDDRFYTHPGVDWRGIIRAAYILLKTNEKKQGGSTITMQVARNFFLTMEKTYTRKLSEVLLAIKIERELSKAEILELYLNKIYLGQRAYGVAAAAQIYYGTTVDRLDLAQTAMIAGLPKAPSKDNPISNPKGAIQRRNYVLQRMLRKNFISVAEYQAAQSAPISASLHGPPIDVEASYVAEMVRLHLLDTIGEHIYTEGLIVNTTLKDQNQIAANSALRKALIKYDRRHGYRGAEQHFDLNSTAQDEMRYTRLLDAIPVYSDLIPGLITAVAEKSIDVFVKKIGMIRIDWPGMAWARSYITVNHKAKQPKYAGEIVKVGDLVRVSGTAEGKWHLAQIPAVQGAFVSIDPTDGAVLALVGGFDFLHSKFNRATQARRQPGSAIKPFIYSAALASGKTAASIINDAPVVFSDDDPNVNWRPKNYSRKNYGPTRLREALIHSRNLVSIRLLDEIGISTALQHIARFGFDTTHMPNNLSLALGSGTTTPWELARGYCVFANGGYLIDPYFIASVSNYKDELLFRADPKKICPSCTQKQHGEYIETLTEDIIEPTGLTAGENDSANDDDNKVNINQAPRTIDPANIYIMSSITRDVIRRGTGRRALSLRRDDLSGKTGTTNEQHDAWFAGFNTDIVAVSWVGFDEFQPLGNSETGSLAALPMWIQYMQTTLAGTPESVMEQPTGIITVRINPKDGQLAKAGDQDAIFELFRMQHSPKKRSEKENNRTSSGHADQHIREQLF